MRYIIIVDMVDLLAPFGGVAFPPPLAPVGGLEGVPIAKEGAVLGK